MLAMSPARTKWRLCCSGFLNMSAFIILVNNAGIAHIGKLENTSEEDFDKVFNVNVKGFYNCMLASVEHMKNMVVALF
jgi:NAD(P)-dependent dehydrogenase (short-subunit alcohol dehydrogenase family)